MKPRQNNPFEKKNNKSKLSLRNSKDKFWLPCGVALRYSKDKSCLKTWINILSIWKNIYPKIEAIFSKFLIILFWSLSAVILFLPEDIIPYFPGGIICQISKIPPKYEKRIHESPYGTLCFSCDRPATRRIKYTGGDHYSFCNQCRPPEIMDEWKGRVYSFPFHVALLIFLYGLNFFRIIFHIISKGNKLKFTYLGALFIFTGTMIYWMSFSIRPLTINFWFGLLIINWLVIITLASLREFINKITQ